MQVRRKKDGEGEGVLLPGFEPQAPWRPRRPTVAEKKHAWEEWNLIQFIVSDSPLGAMNFSIRVSVKSLDALPNAQTLSIDAARRMAAAFPDSIKKKRRP